MVHQIYVIDSLLVQVYFPILLILVLEVLSCIFIIRSGAHHPQGTIGGQKAVTPVVTVHDHVLTLAQIPSHNHGGKTSIEENESIGYNLFAPKPVGTHVPIYDEGGHWYNTRRATQEKSMVHTHTIHSEGHNQPHSHHATASGINLTPPYYALLYIMKL